VTGFPNVVTRLLSAAAVAALISAGASWAIAQTQGPPQAAAPGTAPAATDAKPAPAAQAAPPAQSPSTAGAAGTVAQPSSFPQKTPTLISWSFGGFFGTYDQAQLQRGYQVYKEVCSNCHSMNLVAFRNLGDEGGPHFSADEVKALAAGYTVTDGPNDVGDNFQRAGRPSDYFLAPFANLQAAAASNGGGVPPDLSVIAKSRAPGRGLLLSLVDFFTGYQEAGPDYIHALLTGFSDPPAGVKIPDGTYYNPYFLNAVSLKMPPPLMDGLVTYSDGSPKTVDQYAKDVSAFLMWTAEPHLVERKRMGFEVFVFLLIFAGMMYLTKKRVWAKVAH
jgi:ubiquinol-cytochrome c reductase cytochrome c1 subunit